MINIIYFLLIGLAAGWLAGKIMKGGGYGLSGDLAVGVLGAIIAGQFLGPFIPIPGLLGGIVAATAGACLLLFVIKLVAK